MFDRGHARFNYRSVGVLINDGTVLLHRDRKDDFWSLPGGRVKFFETARDAIVREFKEELDAVVEFDRPLWFVENFFEYEGRDFHEISVYSLLRPDPQCHILRNASYEGIEGDTNLVYEWFRLSDLADLKLRPSFLTEKLSCLPTSMEYLVWRDEGGV